MAIHTNGKTNQWQNISMVKNTNAKKNKINAKHSNGQKYQWENIPMARNTNMQKYQWRNRKNYQWQKIPMTNISTT